MAVSAGALWIMMLLLPQQWTWLIKGFFLTPDGMNFLTGIIIVFQLIIGIIKVFLR